MGSDYPLREVFKRLIESSEKSGVARRGTACQGDKSRLKIPPQYVEVKRCERSGQSRAQEDARKSATNSALAFPSCAAARELEDGN